VPADHHLELADRFESVRIVLWVRQQRGTITWQRIAGFIGVSRCTASRWRWALIDNRLIPADQPHKSRAQRHTPRRRCRAPMLRARPEVAPA